MRQYFIVAAPYPEMLESTVNQHLSSGWELQGGIAVSAASDRNDFFYQALSREKPNPGEGQ